MVVTRGALVGFTEPDAPAQFNMLTTSEGENGTQLLFIHSDESVALFQKVHPSGVTLFPDGSSILIGIDNIINQNSIVLTFHDNAGADAPDIGSTLSLLALALAPLLGANRFRCLRLA